MKGFTLSLSAFSDIKKMNYEEMAKWVEGIYAKGVKDGKASVTSEEAFTAAFESVLKSTYDIGATRAKAIIKQIGKCLCAGNATEGGGKGGKIGDEKDDGDGE